MKYKLWMRDLIRSYVKNDAQLFTIDRTMDYVKGCGLIPGVLGTVDFGIGLSPVNRIIFEDNDATIDWHYFR